MSFYNILKDDINVIIKNSFLKNTYKKEIPQHCFCLIEQYTGLMLPDH